MISVDLARRLRDAGLRWTPQSGDRFVIIDREMDDQVFVLSSMTIEVYEYPSGPVIRFNGTTEWALDSLSQDEALWLPGEDQLRAALGGTFRRLQRIDSRHEVQVAPPADGVVGRAESDGAANRTFSHPDAAEAYGLALLDLLERLA